MPVSVLFLYSESAHLRLHETHTRMQAFHELV